MSGRAEQVGASVGTRPDGAAPSDTSPTIEVGHPTVLSLMLGEMRAQTISFFRTPIAAFFTLVFPLVLLTLVGSLVGNDIIESRSGVRVTQFLTPAIGAYAAATAAYTSLAIGLSIARETGVLRRQHGLPIPTVALLGGRIGAGVVTGFLGVLVMVLVGVTLYDVQIVWGKLPAALLSMVVGIGCFASLGFAVSSLARTSAATQAITNATLVALGFISDVFVVGVELPDVLSRIGGLFPLKAFANAMGEAFNPFTPGAGFAWAHLAMMVGWGLAGAAVASRWFSWEVVRTAGRGRAAGSPTQTVITLPDADSGADLQAATAGATVTQREPTTREMVLGQTVDGIRAIVRTPSSAFFTLAFPVVMLLLFNSVFGSPTLDDRGGISLAQHLAPALGIFGMATVTYAEFAERLATQRDAGILKRIRGTPLTLGSFVAGRIASAIVLGLVTIALVMAVGMVVLGVVVPLDGVLPGLLVVVVTLASFTMMGLALVALAPTAEAVSPLANATLLPAAFVSEVFLIGALPTWLEWLAAALPLRPAVTALSDVLNPEIDVGVPWGRIGTVAVWGLLAGLVFWRRFDWSPRRG